MSTPPDTDLGPLPTADEYAAGVELANALTEGWAFRTGTGRPLLIIRVALSRIASGNAAGPSPASPASLACLAEQVAIGRAKFPGNRFMLPALVEEVGELSRALLQRKGPDAVRAEALDVAAVAIRIFEEGDATFDDITDEEARP